MDESREMTEYSRAPGIEDLKKVCGYLNKEGAKYLIIGGMAMINAGFLRATEDIDLLIEPSAGNKARVKNALSNLPDGAINEIKEDDLENYLVVRVADEIIIDLMQKAGGIVYKDTSGEIITRDIDGIEIPFASPALLYRLKKDTMREKDALDLLYLKELLKIK
jgi:hypothetical protein